MEKTCICPVLRCVSSNWRYEKLYNELGWKLLNLRRWNRCLTLFYKIVNNLTPDYTRNPVPHPHESSYDLRRIAKIGQIQTRTQVFKSSFYPNCLSEWERPDPDIRLSSSVNIVENILSPSQFYYLRQETTRKNDAVRNITLYLNSSYSNTTKTLPRALTHVTRIN